MKNVIQMSESIELGVVLAVSGGFMDAYSFVCRGGVFANAQTGNMLLFGVHLSEGDWAKALRFFLPVMSFAIGIALAELFRIIFKEKNTLHWRQFSVFVEAIILFGVSFFSQRYNLIANSLISFACGIQVESFRKVLGNNAATTMCIGNLRSATQNMVTFLETQKIEALKKSLLYFGIISSFIIGAVIGNFFVKLFQETAIRMCSIFLMIALTMMFVDRELQAQMEE
ncbi:YoaK family protein [Lachnobacterium bovis]|uniref:Uncharacterized membrane protein YoaK, UPF0700 family n=1 Tax=Lachnobacterium bovis TaxID=140626 RepID=A0A1H9P7E1_9FIRM|nr:YoaK family protein [Lachnobacterium bovis]SER44156.1 Uncharacterized membrane protein YoaK, UPF0700 family [Lachnobacterium bovis]